MLSEASDIVLTDLTLTTENAREQFNDLIDIAARFITAAYIEDEEHEKCVQFMKRLHENAFSPVEQKASFVKEVFDNKSFHQFVWDRCKHLPELAKHYIGLLHNCLDMGLLTANETYELLSFVPEFEKGNISTRLRSALHQETMQDYLSILLQLNESIEIEKIGQLLTSKGHAGLNAAMYIGTLDAETNFKFLALLDRLVDAGLQIATLDAILSVTLKGLFKSHDNTYMDQLCDNKQPQLETCSENFLKSIAFQKLTGENYYKEKYAPSENKLKTKKQLMQSDQELLSLDKLVVAHFSQQRN